MTAIKNSSLHWIVVGMSLALLGTTAEAKPAGVARMGQLPGKTAFVPLSPGAIEPAGWLRDWALAARNGITGHLDEWNPTFRDGWKGFAPICGTVARSFRRDATGGPLEQCSYWLDGLVRLGYVLHDDALIRKAKARLDLVVNGVNRGGKSLDLLEKATRRKGSTVGPTRRWAGPWWPGTRRRANGASSTPWSRPIADYPMPMGNLEFADGPPIPAPRAACATSTRCWRPTPSAATAALLDRVRAAIGAPDVQATVDRWLDGRFAARPCRLCLRTDSACPPCSTLATGDPRYLQASPNAFRWIDAEPHAAIRRGFRRGISSPASAPSALPKPATWRPASGRMIWLYRIAGQQLGRPHRAGLLQRRARPIARDFQTMCYYQSPNRIRAESLAREQPKSPGRGCLRFTGSAIRTCFAAWAPSTGSFPTISCICGWRPADGGLAATLYGPCNVSAMAGAEVPVKLTCETAYPFEETIRVTVDARASRVFPLYFRIPSWCVGGKIAVNGASSDATPDAKGFVRLERQSVKGDTVTLIFPMSVRLERGFETEYPASTRNYFDFKSDVVFQRRRLPYERAFTGRC